MSRVGRLHSTERAASACATERVCDVGRTTKESPLPSPPPASPYFESTSSALKGQGAGGRRGKVCVTKGRRLKLRIFCPSANSDVPIDAKELSAEHKSCPRTSGLRIPRAPPPCGPADTVTFLSQRGRASPLLSGARYECVSLLNTRQSYASTRALKDMFFSPPIYVAGN